MPHNPQDIYIDIYICVGGGREGGGTLREGPDRLCAIFFFTFDYNPIGLFFSFFEKK